MGGGSVVGGSSPPLPRRRGSLVFTLVPPTVLGDRSPLRQEFRWSPARLRRDPRVNVTGDRHSVHPRHSRTYGPGLVNVRSVGWSPTVGFQTPTVSSVSPPYHAPPVYVTGHSSSVSARGVSVRHPAHVPNDWGEGSGRGESPGLTSGSPTPSHCPRPLCSCPWGRGPRLGTCRGLYLRRRVLVVVAVSDTWWTTRDFGRRTGRSTSGPGSGRLPRRYDGTVRDLVRGLGRKTSWAGGTRDRG